MSFFSIKGISLYAISVTVWIASYVPKNTFNGIDDGYYGDPPLGKSEEAIAVYQKILEINPNVAVAYCNLGCIWQMQGKFEEAIAAYQRAIKLKPDFALAHRNLEGLLASGGIGLCGWPPISVLGDMVGFAIAEWIVDQKLIRN